MHASCKSEILTIKWIWTLIIPFTVDEKKQGDYVELPQPERSQSPTESHSSFEHIDPKYDT